MLKFNTLLTHLMMTIEPNSLHTTINEYIYILHTTSMEPELNCLYIYIYIYINNHLTKLHQNLA